MNGWNEEHFCSLGSTEPWSETESVEETNQVRAPGVIYLGCSPGEGQPGIFRSLCIWRMGEGAPPGPLLELPTHITHSLYYTRISGSRQSRLPTTAFRFVELILSICYSKNFVQSTTLENVRKELPTPSVPHPR